MTVIELSDIIGNGDNTREPAPTLQGFGYGIVEPVEGADKPSLFALGLGTPDDKRRYCDLVERHEESLTELAASIDRDGQLLNCRLRPTDRGKYVLTFGARRCLAVLYLHAKHGKPATIWATESGGGDERKALIESAAENAHRLPPSFIDQARLFRRMRDLGMTVKEIAALYPMGRSAEQNIRHRLRLLELPPEVQIRVHHGRLSQDAALELLKKGSGATNEMAPAGPILPKMVEVQADRENGSRPSRGDPDGAGMPDRTQRSRDDTKDDLRAALREFVARLRVIDLADVTPSNPDELLELADEARRYLSAVEEMASNGTPVPAR